MPANNKKKKSKAKKPDAGCATCNDTGYVCIQCDHADGDCVCECGPELVRCDNCKPDVYAR